MGNEVTTWRNCTAYSSGASGFYRSAGTTTDADTCYSEGNGIDPRQIERHLFMQNQRARFLGPKILVHNVKYWSGAQVADQVTSAPQAPAKASPRLSLKTSPLFSALRWRFDSPFAPLHRWLVMWALRTRRGMA